MKGHNVSKSTSWTSLIFTFKLPRSLVPKFSCPLVPLFPCSPCFPVPFVPLFPLFLSCPFPLFPLFLLFPLFPCSPCSSVALFPCFPCSSCSPCSPCSPCCPCFPVPIVPLFPLIPLVSLVPLFPLFLLFLCSPLSPCSPVPLVSLVLLANCLKCEFTAHYACNEEMNLKSTSTNGFNFRIINSLMASWGYAWPGLTISDKLEFWYVGFCWEGMGREQSRMSVVTTAVRFILNCTPWRLESLS